jgi:predicted AlkP superfamily pyrophosphatase or phosphodiesterase
MINRRSLISFCFAALWLCQTAAQAAGQAHYYILVVWDGMRPDFVTPELTPTLYSLRQQGVWFANHHSAFPTSTEVNGTVLATGAFPGHSLIQANNEYRPDINPLKPVPTQAIQTIRRGDELTGNKYIAVSTLAEHVQANHEHTAVVGAKPVALLQDRRARPADAPNPIWYAESSLPASLEASLTNQFGIFPEIGLPNTGRDQWAVRCLTEAFWSKQPPRYSVLWLSEPDNSQHKRGPGSPEALAAIRNCDDRLATLLQALEKRGIRQDTDIIVVSDHGFSTIGGGCDVGNTLRKAGFHAQSTWKQPPQTNDIVVVGNGGYVMLYVTGHSPTISSNLVATLQPQPFCGVIFTRDALPGTFALSEAKLGGPSAPDLIITTRWKRLPAQNEHPNIEVYSDGYHGFTTRSGTHGTLSPSDLHNTCVAVGPDFRPGIIDPLPSGNVDIAPTLLHLMGITTKKPLDGRVLKEALVGSSAAISQVELQRLHTTATQPGGQWEQYLNYTELNGVRYLEEGNSQWNAAKPATK